MLEMDQYEFIRIMQRRYKKGIREIARETGHSRVTVRKALAGQVPEYRRSKEIVRPVMGPFEGIIEDWLMVDQGKPKKQRHTAKRIYDRLVEEHQFTGSSSTVRHFVREKKEMMGLNVGEAMVPLDGEMGEAEMDWGEATIVLAGETIKVKMFCMRSRYSGESFVQVYRNERQEMLFDGHIQAFAYFGGVFPVIVYDNMKTVVKKVLKGKGRIEQEAFHQFRSYYTFQSKFCNVASGNEKGGVEGLVKFSRRNFLVPIPEVETLEELNQMLVEKCQAYRERVLGGREDKRTVGARANEEKKVLQPLIKPYEALIPREAKINKYQMVQCDRNRYSVPGSVGKMAKVYLGCAKVQIYLGKELVAEHARSFSRDRWIMNPSHYLRLLEKKVRAFDNAKPIKQWRKKWPANYERLLTKLRERDGEAGGTRAFLKVLMLHDSYQAEEVETAVELAWESGTHHWEAVKMILEQLREEEGKPPQALDPQRLCEQAQITVEEPDTTKYDQLAGVA